MGVGGGGWIPPQLFKTLSSNIFMLIHYNIIITKHCSVIILFIGVVIKYVNI